MLILSVDELRVATAVMGTAVPSILDEYATDEPGADAAATRSLVARELAEPRADEPLAIEIGPALRDALDVLRVPESVLELDLSAGSTSVRCAEIRDVAGRVRVLSERSRHIWCLDDQPMIGAALVAVRPIETGSGDVVELGLAEHAKLDELLAQARHADIRTLLGDRGRFLAEALTDPAGNLGRLTRASRADDDGIAIERITWVSAACGTWAVEDADPGSDLTTTTFTPVEPADLTADIDSMANSMTNSMTKAAG